MSGVAREGVGLAREAHDRNVSGGGHPGNGVEEVDGISRGVKDRDADHRDVDRSESGDRATGEHALFVASLTPEEVQLITLRDELYEGSWEDMRRDLEHRRDGKPFIYKLMHRIEEDLKRIARLSEYEVAEEIDLGDYVDDR